MEALQSCLPHQLDLCTGQLWALHQQRQVVRASAYAQGSLIVPPDSEIVAPVFIRSPAGIPPCRCSMIEPTSEITESYGVLVGRTLVDTSKWSARVLVINPGSGVVVLPPFSCVGDVHGASVRFPSHGQCRLDRMLTSLSLHISRIL